MRLSIVEDDPGYEPTTHNVGVYFNGKQLSHCVTADEAAGCALVNMVDENGSPYLIPGTKEVARQWLYGDVKILLPGKKLHGKNIKEVECKRWPLPNWVQGITLYPFIFYQGPPTSELRAHEWIHIEQVRRLGWLRFYVSYIVENIRHGYEKNKYEIEARERTARWYLEKWGRK